MVGAKGWDPDVMADQAREPVTRSNVWYLLLCKFFELELSQDVFVSGFTQLQLLLKCLELQTRH